MKAPIELVSGGFRERLRALRRAKGLSQSDLAREVWGTIDTPDGYTVARNRDRISVYEAGKAVPTQDYLVMLAQALGVSPDELAPDLVMKNPKAFTSGPASTFEMKVLGADAHLKMDAILPLRIAAQIVEILYLVPGVEGLPSGLGGDTGTGTGAGAAGA